MSALRLGPTTARPQTYHGCASAPSGRMGFRLQRHMADAETVMRKSGRGGENGRPTLKIMDLQVR